MRRGHPLAYQTSLEFPHRARDVLDLNLACCPIPCDMGPDPSLTSMGRAINLWGGGPKFGSRVTMAWPADVSRAAPAPVARLVVLLREEFFNRGKRVLPSRDGWWLAWPPCTCPVGIQISACAKAKVQRICASVGFSLSGFRPFVPPPCPAVLHPPLLSTRQLYTWLVEP